MFAILPLSPDFMSRSRPHFTIWYRQRHCQSCATSLNDLLGCLAAGHRIRLPLLLTPLSKTSLLTGTSLPGAVIPPREVAEDIHSLHRIRVSRSDPVLFLLLGDGGEPGVIGRMRGDVGLVRVSLKEVAVIKITSGSSHPLLPFMSRRKRLRADESSHLLSAIRPSSSSQTLVVLLTDTESSLKRPFPTAFSSQPLVL